MESPFSGTSQEEGLSRKIRILRAAAKCIEERGYRGTNIREIAKESGIKGGSIYYHFSGKQEILFEIMNHSMNDLITNVKEDIKAGSDAFDKLRRAMKFHITYHIDNPYLTRVGDQELRSLSKQNYGVIVRKRREYEEIFVNILQEGVAEGSMQMESVRLISIATLQLCNVHYWYKKDKHINKFSPDELVNQYSNLLFEGIAAQGFSRKDRK